MGPEGPLWPLAGTNTTCTTISPSAPSPTCAVGASTTRASLHGWTASARTATTSSGSPPFTRCAGMYMLEYIYYAQVKSERWEKRDADHEMLQ
nr:unnamed protein product [Callosobruchus chinensis]